VLLFVGVDERAECVEQTVQRVLLIRADFVHERVQPLDRRIVLLLVL
jgi:predicted nucleotidyltransferase